MNLRPLFAPRDCVERMNDEFQQVCRDGEKYQAEIDKKTEEYLMDYGTWNEFFNESNGQERKDLWLSRGDPAELGRMFLRLHAKYCEHLAKKDIDNPKRTEG